MFMHMYAHKYEALKQTLLVFILLLACCSSHYSIVLNIFSLNFTCFLAWLTNPNTLSKCGLLISAPMRVPSNRGSPTGMALVLFTTSFRNWGIISLWTYTLVPLQQTWVVERSSGDTRHEPGRDRPAATGKASPAPASGSSPWARPSLHFPAHSL